MACSGAAGTFWKQPGSHALSSQSPLSPAAGTSSTWQIPCESQGGLREQRLRWEEEDPKKPLWVPWGLAGAGAGPTKRLGWKTPSQVPHQLRERAGEVRGSRLQTWLTMAGPWQVQVDSLCREKAWIL